MKTQGLRITMMTVIGLFFFLASSNAQDGIFEYDSGWVDTFESYDVGSWPPAWVPDANAYNEGYVDDSWAYSGSKSLYLQGSLGGCWAAIAYRTLAVSPPFEIELMVLNGEEPLSGCHPYRAYIGQSSRSERHPQYLSHLKSLLYF